MTRRVTAAATLALIATIVGYDVAGSVPMNRFKAPPLFALGSGEAASGAHCAAMPMAE